MNRQELFDWLAPWSQDVVAVEMSGGKFGWVYDEADANLAKQLWREGRLGEFECTSTLADGNGTYTIKSVTRLGLVLHRNFQVGRFCIDIDGHGEGATLDTAMVRADEIDKMFGCTAVRWTSRGGKGLHLFFALESPIHITAWLKWCKSFGFNGQGQPEAFPKSAAQSQVWLPNDPNPNRGDDWTGGAL
jgi:hypothetical protein